MSDVEGRFMNPGPSRETLDGRQEQRHLIQLSPSFRSTFSLNYPTDDGVVI